MFSQSHIDPGEVASVTIGTTHFVNAVVEMDRSRLARVAVIRLCGPFSADIPVGVDWPPKLRRIICAHRSLVDGGLEIDGSLIAELDEDAIRRECEIIKSKGIKSIVVVGIFSPIDVHFKQEERTKEVIREVYPEADVVLSKEVANIGFLERENAAILNASILAFARRTIHSFQDAVSRLNLRCPVFVTQNDGTILPASSAARLPIRTFSSGPTNSMRGAAFLTQHLDREKIMVVDIGGTTTDVGLLLENGFPRQAAAYSEICGVRTNFSYPDVRSIGLGGGSIVAKGKDGKLTIGPESVGYQIQEKALVFGGTVPTATDYTVLGNKELDIGDRSKLESTQLRADLADFQANVKSMLERIVDTMKTSPEDIPVVLVGGGAVIAPKTLVGASRVIMPDWSGVANAIGAATARVSGVVDSIESTESQTVSQVIATLSERAIERAVENGATRESISIAEVESFPLQYVANQSRIIIKAVGDFDFSRTDFECLTTIDGDTHDFDASRAGHEEQINSDAHDKEDPTEGSLSLTQNEIDEYKPHVIDRQWYLSETDLDWITTGCYILGTGGGGSPYQHMLRLREMLRAGATVRIISPWDLKDEDLVACGGGKGSPQVSIEKPYGDEMMESQRELYQYLKIKPHAVIPLEIGGGNGLQGLIIGASTNMDIPSVALSRCSNTIDTVAESIINEVGGSDSAKILFKGKIVGVERITKMGHAYGEVVIEASTSGDKGTDAVERLRIPFKNENILAKKTRAGGNEEVSLNIDCRLNILAIVPDLVCVIDAQNGEAIGTQEYRYGLLVIVLGITASEKWTCTPRGIEVGGPKGFGMNDLEYRPLGKFQKPRSVIDEFNRVADSGRIDGTLHAGGP
ncbi:putative hydantoin utilization protein A [Pseudomassariella vexata]|uniref:Putative hydantoin utilization protein A n=1 Tax=Pseudomassariella vexata TaxID=1141098 RepID=A0A1Y2DP37_9PEZI|nr:putative hydantoin utilization protein A [Pseudomassariella vexata]ORY61010.1 putative hydantoin utilization protein A [Pseudomassariella vexata]